MDTRINSEFSKLAINRAGLSQVAIFYDLKHKWFGWDLGDWAGLISRLINTLIIEKNPQSY